MVRIVAWIQARPRSWFVNEIGCETRQIEGVRHYMLMWLDQWRMPVHSYSELTELFKQAIDEQHHDLPVWDTQQHS